ncbi:MAG: hypothetical protein HYU66_23470 [Armatimonadetes bacterium]|nr:hypothetical protein [Armatimonadota bacterium]
MALESPPPEAETAHARPEEQRARTRVRERWEAGWAELSYAPSAGTPLGATRSGWPRPAAERLSEALRIRAVALRAAGSTVVLVACEAALVDVAFAAAVRAAAERLGAGGVVVSAALPGAPALLGAARSGFSRAALEVAAGAVRLAVGRLAPATLALATAPLGGGVDERQPYLDALVVTFPGGGRQAWLAAAARPGAMADGGVVGRGALGEAERVLQALGDARQTLSLLPRSEVGEPDAEPVEEQSGLPLAAALTGAAVAPWQGLEPRLERVETAVTVPTQPLPDEGELRATAERAEYEAGEGPAERRAEAAERLAWLTRVKELRAEGRRGSVRVPVTRLRLGALRLCGVGAALSPETSFALAERLGDEPAMLVSGCGGRAAALLARPGRGSLAGAAGLEPLTDVWPLTGEALGAVGDALQG